jgi:hypothetical protein
MIGLYILLTFKLLGGICLIYGVYTSEHRELIVTPKTVLDFYRLNDHCFGSALYNRDCGEMHLIGVCERDQLAKVTIYAFINAEKAALGNDKDLKQKLGKCFNFDDLTSLKQSEIIKPVPADQSMPTVSDAGIGKCLKLWKLGNALEIFDDALEFTMNTNKFKYVFILRASNDDIYCGASVTVPCENGLFGGSQYFRIRNFYDNSLPFCRFSCELGSNITIPTFDSSGCASGTCQTTDDGIFWSVKRSTDDEIILQGCGDDEYPYFRNLQMNERFE